jgi:hypothetical protein
MVGRRDAMPIHEVYFGIISRKWHRDYLPEEAELLVPVLRTAPASDRPLSRAI